MNARALFELLAQTTWRTLDHAHREDIAFGEDAVTSVNLLALASLQGHAIIVEDSRADEHHTGCDFELWIRTREWRWVGYAVQAKKLSARTGRFEKLAHTVNGQRQIDILNVYARKRDLLPVYCFFSGAQPVSSWNCQLPRVDEQLGCMVTPSRVVENALKIRGARSFSWLHRQPESIPWRCLLTCEPLSRSHIRDGNQIDREFVSNRPTERLPDELMSVWSRRQFGVLRENLVPAVPWEGVSYFPRSLAIVDATDTRG